MKRECCELDDGLLLLRQMRAHPSPGASSRNDEQHERGLLVTGRLHRLADAEELLQVVGAETSFRVATRPTEPATRMAPRGGNTPPSPAGSTRLAAAATSEYAKDAGSDPCLIAAARPKRKRWARTPVLFKPGTTRLPGTQSDHGWARSGGP